MNKRAIKEALRKSKYMKGKPLSKKEMWDVINGYRSLDNLKNLFEVKI